MRIAIVGVMCALTDACTAPRPQRLIGNPDVSGNIPAIKDAVAQRDRHAARRMVAELDSDDPAVRFYAIQGLQRLTGETFGYRYFDDEDERAEAVGRWKKWLAGQKGNDQAPKMRMTKPQ